MAKAIPLSKGLVALVDDDDFAALAKHRWYARIGKWGAYAGRNKPGHGTTAIILMHREILNAGESDLVDHRNGVTLDNRRENLRLCTALQNARNATKTKTGTHSKYKGVCRWQDRPGWRATVCVDKRQRYLGSFGDEKQAARAYDAAARAYHGDFARTNEDLYPEDFAS